MPLLLPSEVGQVAGKNRHGHLWIESHCCPPPSESLSSHLDPTSCLTNLMVFSVYPTTGVPDPWAIPVRNRATQQDVSSRQASKDSSVLAAAPQC